MTPAELAAFRATRCPECGFESNDVERVRACAERDLMAEARRVAMREHLDRRPPRDKCECGHAFDFHEDRPANPLMTECLVVGCNCQAYRRATHRSWFQAISEDPSAPLVYLGERSARVGPDAVAGAHRCGCEQCAEKP